MRIKQEFFKIRLTRRSSSERGQSFVELALSITFLLMLVAVIVELGWAFYTMIALRDAAQEASAFGSICPNEPAKVIQRLRKSASAPLNMEDIAETDIITCIVDPSGPNPNDCGAPIAVGNAYKVTITVHHQILTPFVGGFIGSQQFPLSVTTVNTLLRTKCYE
jgi:Flp pilus assembly protein TadG